MQRIQHVHIVENAGRRSVAYHRLGALSLDAVDDSLDRDLCRWSIDHVHLVPFTDRDSGGVAEPLRVIECSALGNGGTSLFTRKPRMKWRIQKKYSHTVITPFDQLIHNSASAQ